MTRVCKWIVWPFLLMGTLFVGCIDPIDLDLGEADRRLVVEGIVRQGTGPHYVILSRTGVFTQGLHAVRERERGASVEIITGSGEAVRLAEVAPGRYEPEPGALVGAVGDTYTLMITLAEGTAYQSSTEVMLPAPGIADLYAELQPYTEVVNGVSVGRHRLALLADAERIAGQENYYRWTWTATYAILTCLGLECDTCFRPLSSRSIVEVGDDLNITGPVVPRNEVASFRLYDRLPAGAASHTPPVVGWAFAFGLQISVEQQSLSAGSHHYWDRVRALRDNVGSLFDPPSENVVGNVHRVGGASEFALGHFTVVGTAHRNACLRRSHFQSEWPGLPNPHSYIGTCGGSVSGSTVPPQEWSAACSE